MTSDKSAVNRYSVVERDHGYEILRSVDGWFVEYTDHAAALQAARDSCRAEFVAKIQSAIGSIEVPKKITAARAEYFKAGCREVIIAVQLALAPAKKVD